MKRIMNKSVVLTLAIAMLLVPCLITGGAAEAQTKITFWTLFSGGEGYIVSSLVEQFNKEHPDIVVEEQVIEWGQYYNKLMTGLLAGEAPNVGIMHLAVLPDYASRGVLNPIEGGVPEGFADRYLPNIFAQAQYDGSLYAIPLDTHPMVMYYNKSVLKEAGIAEENMIPKSWDDLMANAEQVKDNTGKWGMTFETGPMFGERLWIATYSQFGAKFLDEATGKLVVDAEKAAQAYELMNSFVKAEVVPAPADYNECESLFINNESAYHLNGVWAMSVYPETEGLEFGVTSLPALEGSAPYTWGDSHSLVFPKGSDPEQLKAALTFGEWFSGKTMEWAKAGHLPVNKAVMESEDFLNLPMRADYVGVGANAVLAPSVKGWTQIRQEMWEVGERLIGGDLDPQTAAEEIKTKIEDISAAQE